LRIRQGEPPFFYFLLGSFLLHLLFLAFLSWKKTSLPQNTEVSFELVSAEELPPMARPSLSPEPLPRPSEIPAVERVIPVAKTLPRKATQALSMVREIKIEKDLLLRGGFSAEEIPALPQSGVKPASAPRKEAGSDYFSQVRRLIEEAKVYPLRARLAGYEGEVRVSFCIRRDGRVFDIKLLSPSPYEVLNQAALKTIERAAPFPPPPSTLSAPLCLNLKMTFRLEK